MPSYRVSARLFPSRDDAIESRLKTTAVSMKMSMVRRRGEYVLFAVRANEIIR